MSWNVRIDLVPFQPTKEHRQSKQGLFIENILQTVKGMKLCDCRADHGEMTIIEYPIRRVRL